MSKKDAIKTTADLRAGLLETLTKLRAGKVTVNQARAEVRLVEGVMEIVRVELIAARLGKDAFPALDITNTHGVRVIDLKVIEHEQN